MYFKNPARKLAKKLVVDKDFYKECSEKAKNNFYQHSSENAFNKWKENFFSNVDEFIDGWNKLKVLVKIKIERV